MTRLPFLLALSWSFFWGWQIYGYSFGYIDDYRDRYTRFELMMLRAEARSRGLVTGDKIPDDVSEFHRICGALSPDLNFDDEKVDISDWSAKTRVCKAILETRFEWSQKTWLDSKTVQIPASFESIPVNLGSIQTSDLGVVGQVGTVLTLLWGFLAIRRENHSIKAFVDRDGESQKSGRVMPKKFALIPQDSNLSSEHYVFAYHAVSESFVFLFSRYSRPVLFTTMMLFLFPAFVAALGFFEDAIYFFAYQQSYAEPALYVRLICEAALLIVVVVVSWLQMRTIIETSSLLNGWCLAVKDVWTRHWDERDQEEAPTVEIDVDQQKGAEMREGEHGAKRGAPSAPKGRRFSER